MSKSTKTVIPAKAGIQKNNGVVPRLRFPEFRDAGEWEARGVGEVFNVTRGYVLSMTLVSDTKAESTPYPVYSSQTKLNGLCGYYSEYLYEDAITWTTDGANAGDVNFRVGKFYCTNVCGVLISQDGYANPCIAELINSVAKNHVSYVGNPKLMNGVMSKIVIPFPSLIEQQRIANCLSSLDALIAAQAEKIDALKTHKKGLMQQLFPREGETAPRLRFPEFRDAGKWEEKDIGGITQVSAGATPDTSSISYWGGDIPWMNSGELNLKRVFNVSNRITTLGLQQTSTKLIPAGCVLIGLAGQGKTRGTAAINYIELCTNQSIASIHPNKDQFTSEFLFQKIDSMYSYLRSLSKGEGGRGGLNLQILKSIKIPFPSLPEQQKIANCLSSLDALIVAQADKLDALKTHKKGLMQQLFPAVETVSA